MRRPTRLLSLALAPVAAAAVVSVPLGAGAAPAVPATFTLTGAGWGHGVGMSQYGARGMAQEGSTATQILGHYFTGTQVAAVRDDQDVRVGLHASATNIRMRTEGLVAGGGKIRFKAGSTVVRGVAGDRFRLKSVKGQVRLSKNKQVVGRADRWTVRWSGTRYRGGSGSLPAVLNVVKKGQKWASAGHRYRYGKVNVIGTSGGSAFHVVNFVRLHDEYLYGIAEMPSSWPAAALQAQAVAARSYAVVKRAAGLRASCRCHLDPGVSDQVFAGHVKETDPMGDRWRTAVDGTAVGSTQGRVVTYRGVPVQTYYSSSTGGRTQNSEDVWVTAVPYLRSVDDRWSLDRSVNPYASWSATRAQAAVAAAFGLPDVVSVDLSDRNASGAVRTARATSSTGRQAALTGPALVSRLGLTSRWVTAATPTA